MKAKQVENMIREYADAWSSQDVERICGFFTDDCFFEDVPCKVSACGISELREFLGAVFRAVPDLQMKLDRVHVGTNFAVTEWVQSGTSVEEFANQKPTGERYSRRTASVIEFRGDRISRTSDYWDISRPPE